MWLCFQDAAERLPARARRHRQAGRAPDLQIMEQGAVDKFGERRVGREIDLRVSAGSIDGNFLTPPPGAKLDKRNCSYKQGMGIAALHWVPE